MIKELGMAAVMSTSLNAIDISLQDFTESFTSNTAYTKSFKKSKGVSYLSAEAISKLKYMGEELIKVGTQQLHLLENDLKSNFDIWIVTDSKQTIESLESIQKVSQATAVLFKKFSKEDQEYYRELSKMELTISKIFQKHCELIAHYKPMIEEAKEAVKFMETFIPNNEKVLRALA